MFTINQIKEAHAKVKSGADFPKYIQEIKKLGVESYSTYVTDGHALFQGSDGSQATWEAKYAAMPIAPHSNKEQFIKDLKEHQQGKTDYLTFCNSCATLGVEKWAVSLSKMTCTYFDVAGNELLVELIPE